MEGLILAGQDLREKTLQKIPMPLTKLFNHLSKWSFKRVTLRDSSLMNLDSNL